MEQPKQIHLGQDLDKADHELEILNGLINKPFELIDWMAFAAKIELAILALEAAEVKAKELDALKKRLIAKKDEESGKSV
jgi:hypothetical protein